MLFLTFPVKTKGRLLKDTNMITVGIRHLNLPLPTCWWSGTCALMLLVPEKNSAGSYHKVYKGMVRQMHGSGPIPSQSWVNWWYHHWATRINYFPNDLLSAFLSVHPKPHPHARGPKRLAGSVVLQNWEGLDLLTIKNGGHF